MRGSLRSALGLLGLLLVAGAAQARVFVGVGIGIPVWGPPCCGWGWRAYYYAPVIYTPPPVVYTPPPVVVTQPAPTIIQPAPTVIQSPPATSAAPANPVPPTAVSVSSPQVEIEGWLQRLSHPDEGVRREAALQLGRLRAAQAVDPLAATLAGDRSPTVREAAARALGMIGSPQALPALERAAQADPDRDVRYSAQFAVDIIQSRR